MRFSVILIFLAAAPAAAGTIHTAGTMNLPAIDMKAPGTVKTATFALG